MKLALPRRAQRRFDFRVRTYGVTAALGLFTIGGVIPQCAPAPAPAPAVVQVSNVQDSAVYAVNYHRARAGRGAVTIDSRLTAAAQGHSNYMATQRTMTHTGAGGTNGGHRITNAGYRWTTWGENVAAGQLTPTDVMTAWLNSPGHRANILHSGVVHIGIAAAKGSNGVIYWTMVVAAR